MKRTRTRRKLAGAPAIAEQAHTYVGRRCLRGHSGLRYRSTRGCVYCHREFSVDQHQMKKMRLFQEADIDA